MRRSIATSGIVVLVGGLLASSPSTASAAPQPSDTDRALTAADASISANPEAIAGSDGETYRMQRTITDRDGASHVRYTRSYNGLPVLGGDFVIHNAPDGSLAGVSNGLSAPINLNTRAVVPAETAVRAARQQFTGSIIEIRTPRLVIEATAGVGRLAWETTIRGMDGQTPSSLHVFTDANNNGVLSSYDEVRALDPQAHGDVTGGNSPSGGTGNGDPLAVGTGSSVYSGTVSIDTTQAASGYTLVDPNRPGGLTCDMNQGSSTCKTFANSTNSWGNGTNTNRASAGVDAHFGAEKTFDYFKNVHGRNGIFGDGKGVPSRVHYGNAYVNAFWDGKQMTYGDGQGNQRPLVAMDVAGHEMSHGVTQALAGLVYSGESGGLNEATSDIFGNMVEFYANNASDPGDYDIGEKINIFGNGKPLRYMYDPAKDGKSQSCWSTTTQNVDVHYSSGVGNHFFFNLAEGTGATAYGTSPVCNNAPAVTGIGRAKAEKIWYRALDVYFTSTTRYVLTSNPGNTSRAYTLSAAKDLYGMCSAEYKAVQAAWTAVNVAGTDTACAAVPATEPTHCLNASQLLGNPGFESGIAPWTASPSTIGAWSGARTGTRAAWISGHGAANTDRLSQTVTLPGGCSKYTLSFWMKIASSEDNTSAFDKMAVQAHSANTATTLATYSNLDRSTGYVQHTLDLTAFAGHTITLTFVGFEDRTLPTSFMIDDTAITMA